MTRIIPPYVFTRWIGHWLAVIGDLPLRAWRHG